MQSFDNAKAIAGAPRIVTDPQLKNLLSDRVRDWAALGLLTMTHLVLIEVGDTDAAIIEELGFSPLVNPLDGKRHGMEGFVLHRAFAPWLALGQRGWRRACAAELGPRAWIRLPLPGSSAGFQRRSPSPKDSEWRTPRTH